MASAMRSGGSKIRSLLRTSVKNTVRNEEEWPAKGVSDKMGIVKRRGLIRNLGLKEDRR
jgi:hypothetical protein